MFGKLEEIVNKVSDAVFQRVYKRLLNNEPFLNQLKEKITDRGYLIFSFRDVHVKNGNKYVLEHKDHLVEEICKALGKKPGNITLDRFSDSSSLFTINENVRRMDIYTIFNPNPEKEPEGELLRFGRLIETIKSCHGGNITAVMPNAPDSRQDQSYGKRQLITSKSNAELLKHFGVNHVITIGLHAPQIEGFYVSIDHLKTRPIFSHYLQQQARNRFTKIVELEPDETPKGVKFYREYIRLISPDAGGMRGINELRKDMDPDRKIDVGFIQKERTGINVSESGKVVGDVKGKIVVLYDDIMDTGGSLFKAAEALKKDGAKYVIACIDHALCNNKEGEEPFEEQFSKSYIDELVVTNTQPEILQRVEEDERLAQKTTVLSIAPLLKEAIIRDQKGYTIRDMVDKVGRKNLYHILHQSENSKRLNS